MARKNKSKKMATFRLWALPQLARKRVFQHFGLEELISLSMDSGHVKRFLTAYKPHVAELTWKFSSLRARPIISTGGRSEPYCNYMCLRLDFPAREQKILYHFIGNNREDEPMETLNGALPIKKFRLSDKDRAQFVIIGREDYQNADPGNLDMKFLEKLSNHFKSIFHINDYNLRYHHAPDFELFESFIWKFTKKFKILQIEKKQIDDITARFLFNDLEIEYLMLDVDTDFYTISGLNLTHPKLRVGECDWLTMEDVKNSESKFIDINLSVRMKVDELVQLVSDWKSGEYMKNLEMLEFLVSNERGTPELNKKEETQFFEELKKRGILLPKRPENDTKWKEEITGYVQRTTDGAIAKIRFDGYSFHFDLEKEDNKEEKRNFSSTYLWDYV